ncbi:AlpA family transcriptional regulator [Photobacterium sp. SDRW27]|uniref:helix-turn-helix transcriptional regulator n=1 Tax=Photobacterium obscurum TaxID=2829490 RepID=UPI002243F2CE|nr:AlpA family transcriptional regulator [Photobacterium obscurum]MCW8331947.1 AlpA family transcriptional regulator [Photobacterium obscurum]
MERKIIKLITLREVIALTGLSRSTIYKYINENRFPQQIPVGDRAVRWDEEEVQSWINSKIKLR